jgi:hypothetical protein
MRNTKWTTEVAVEPPELPDEFWEQPGITPVEGVVEQAVGEEVILLMNDPTEHAEAFGSLDPFELHVASGSVDTEHGSLGFVLFIVPNQEEPTRPHHVWEILFDPRDDEMTEPFHRLAEQSHWHAILFGPGPEVINIFEFDNSYFLDAGMQEIAEQTEGKPCTDFAKATAAAHEAYSLEELYEASLTPAAD